jgi:hypothetical protein
MRGRGTDLFAVFVILEEVQEDELEGRNKKCPEKALRICCTRTCQQRILLIRNHKDDLWMFR